MNDVPEGYMKDSKDRLVRISHVKEKDFLEDQTVKGLVAHAEDLHKQIARFRGYTSNDVDTFMDILAEKYDAKKGGAKGNVTLTSYDGCQKVVVQVQDYLDFGPELQIAKSLFDECIREWSKGADDNIHALVDHAFQVDKKGLINRSALFGLRRVNIDDEKWLAAISALNDSIRVQGSREYVRFYKRPSPRDKWTAITIDLASAQPVSTQEEKNV